MHHSRHSNLLARSLQSAHVLAPSPYENAFEILVINLISSIQSALGYFYACENQPPLMYAYATGPKSFQGYIFQVFVSFIRNRKRRRHYIPWLFELSTTLSERLMRSWARQRFVAASSRRTEEKVASRRGSGRHWRRASRARALSLSLTVYLAAKHVDFMYEGTYLRKHLTTCFKSRTVCCSTS